MDTVLADYFAAWNEIDADERERLLRRSLSDGAELVDPLGRWQGVAGISDRIAAYHGRRVVELAATGGTNREIAQMLFVTEKTVETHLGRAFRKLDVASRRQLPEVLARTPG